MKELKNTKIINITSKDLYKIKTKKLLLTSTNQIALDEDKINNIKETFRDMPEYILTLSPFVVGIMHDGESSSEYWLIDGHHRFNAAADQYKEDDINNTFSMTFIYLTSYNHLSRIFELINKDSHKVHNFIKSTTFQKKFCNDVKFLLKTKYEGYYREKKSSRSNVMTVDEFMNDMIDNNFQNIEISIEKFKKQLDRYHKKFFNEISYLESIDHDNLFYADEIKILSKHQNCMFLKLNNLRKCFMDFLQDVKVINPQHEYRNIREKITPSLRSNVWKKEFGNKAKGTCPITSCRNHIMKQGYVCGHVVSCKNGGNTDVDNLRPICGDCNMRMGSMEWSEYDKKYLWENNKKKCSECKKKIKKYADSIIHDDSLFCASCYDKLEDGTSDSESESSDCSTSSSEAEVKCKNIK